VENDALQGPSAVGQCVDVAALDKLRTIGDDAFVVEMINALLSFAPRVLTEARTALEAGNLEPVSRMGHSLKSSARILGADTMREIASRIEKYAREGRTDPLSGLLTEMERAYSEVKVYLMKVKENGGKAL
jgi:HPt (histidine-containing phosphotransfer) domain-containing protein